MPASQAAIARQALAAQLPHRSEDDVDAIYRRLNDTMKQFNPWPGREMAYDLIVSCAPDDLFPPACRNMAYLKNHTKAVMHDAIEPRYRMDWDWDNYFNRAAWANKARLLV